MVESVKSSIWQRRQKTIAKQQAISAAEPLLVNLSEASLVKKFLDGGSSLENEAKRAVAALVWAHSPTRAHANSGCRLINLARCPAPLTATAIKEES